MDSAVEDLIRAMDINKAKHDSASLWRKIRNMREESQTVDEFLFKRVLLCSARCVLAKLEESGGAEEQWIGYLDFFMEAVRSFGTRYADPLLGTCEEVFHLVLGYPEKPRDLFHEYLFCLSAQRHQCMGMNPNLAGTAPKCPMLENKSTEVALVPEVPLNEVRQYVNDLPQRLTFPLQNGVVRMRLGNPLPIPDVGYVRGGYRCDTCCISNIQVAYQAMLYDDMDKAGVRSAVHFRNLANRVGFDMCVACAVYFYRDAVLRLSQFLGDHSRTFRVGPDADVQLHSFSSEGNVVKFTVSILPWGARPIVWIADKEEYNPPAAWRLAVKIESCNQYDPSRRNGGSDDDQCAICLQLLANGTPVLETPCKHCFHVDCVQEMRSMMDDECPFCRRENVFTSCVNLTSQLNMYKVQVDLPNEAKEIVLAVGSLLTSDGEYNNPTNIAACRSILVRHSCIMDFEAERKKNSPVS
ncbi:hypothetical protein TcCL_ESM02429 [Trypanosoma cruzi]|uniref:RING-type domain-containing protein n=2 Tax=Trypanosoma cruzi TaxID=5693 RepID=Q4E1P7_TRYCC|nr:hypothetical protein, conserved [Trypanosoma cruzi]EAN98689.1 hypothetical protein, conserved [Trypanosoma cruzi]RNC59869.1 hypothetical protein TcCL_ESM02429 [Trypanosoma cruzi]|eukprot:XP_820540.1 hypothetical protein [Trypanosoma cruzi strain CL Brener]